ncbi:unnamed protein product [Gordionus sp. m RMFG-2023]
MNSSKLNCTNLFDIFDFNTLYINLYKYGGSILFIMGVIGNTLGLIAASPTNKYHSRNSFKNFNQVITKASNQGPLSHIEACDNSPCHSLNYTVSKLVKRKRRSSNINQYLLKWFFAVNLFNVFRALGIRLLEVFELGRAIRIYTDLNQHLSFSSSWIDDYGWNFYMTKIHFPTTNPFKILGFMIYVLLFLNQMIAMNYPFSYKKFFTIKRLRIIIVICFAYAVVWCIPTFNWLKIIAVTICPYKSNIENRSHITTFYDSQFSVNLSKKVVFYTYINNQVDKPIIKELWFTYQISRELFTKIFPFIAIIVFKMMILRRTNKIMLKIDYENTITIDSRKDYSITQAGVITDGKNYNEELGSKGEGRMCSDSPRYKRKLKEKNQNLKTMLILSIEFVVLLLPTSIYQILIDTLLLRRRYKNLMIWQTIFIIMEFIYICCTFFINFTFNDMYRHHVIKRFRPLLL